MAAGLAADPGAMSCAAPSLNGVRVLVFVSTGMPQAELARLFEEADNRTDVQFVLRGWDDLVQAGSRISAAKGKARVNVIVYPQLFRGYGIEQVPVFLVQKEGRWYRVTGSVGLPKAEELAGTLAKPKEPLAAVYGVTEPDMVDVIEKRVAQYDWEGAVQRARHRFLERWVSYVSLPPAPVGSEHTRLVDPSVVATQDIAMPDGSVAIAAGSAVNPLDYVALDKPIVVFDPRRRCEMSFAKAFPEAHFLVTALNVETMEQFGREVFVAPPETVERLGVWATPAVITQENRMLRVETKPCAD